MRFSMPAMVSLVSLTMRGCSDSVDLDSKTMSELMVLIEC